MAVPTLAGSAAYAVAENRGMAERSLPTIQEGKGFYATIAMVIVVGYLLNFVHTISPVKALLYAAVLNGLVAPPLIVVLLFICNNRKIVGKNANGWLSNTLGIIAMVLMSLAGGLLIWLLCTGKFRDTARF